MRTVFAWIVGLLAAMAPLRLQAIDVYTLLDQDCGRTQGLLIDVNGEQIKVLGLDGKAHTLQKSLLTAIVVHSTLGSPFRSLDLNGELGSYARRVYVSNMNAPDFTGWPVRFIENLIVFFDSTGRSQVVDMAQVRKIRPYDGAAETLTLAGDEVAYNYGDLGTRCQNLPRSASGLRFSRIIGDKIQIEEFLSSFEAGFRSLDDFQERTYLYARPLLYPPGVRLGFPIFGAYTEAPAPLLPFYFQAAQGAPYHFQSLTQIGGADVEWSPTLMPQFVLRTEVKSHLFHASFVGNALALSAGSSYFDRLMPHEGGTLKNNVAKTIYQDGDAAFLGVSFNYMAFMGLDYGPWSVSFGQWYPVYLFFAQGKNREATGDQSSPLYRLMYTGGRFRVFGVYSPVRMLDGAGDLKDYVYLGQDRYNPAAELKSARVETQFYRFGAEWELRSDFKIGGDLILHTGRYDDMAKATGVAGFYEFRHTSYDIWIGRQFGSYVNAKAVWQAFDFKEEFKMAGAGNGQFGREHSQLGGYFEFIF